MAEKKPYHRENLKRDLFEAGRDFVQKHGHHELSMRTLAQLASVSPGAAYHHFADRRAILLAVAIDGFERLLNQVIEPQETELSPVEMIKAGASRFVRFALENPYLIELMYESELTRPQIDPALHHYQEISHAKGVAVIRQFLPDISDKEADLRNITLWTSIYGLVSMINKGIIRPFENGKATIDDISDWVLERAARSTIGD
ncbi:TetR/AcrR family transcriptional regulator [Novosphingobium sediminicola]|uniref:AcrR family transcriptional regulator n=1 Tax=Novosphingobium sediminicola TaxID=563162 RepID=A0A7W6G5B4_9SPHN|nr:TetR/AcrR family transcriptional regulator [Novosphingobium sediminicola]MBB3954088.1 AcrR family transcriptional regulator [Novosphingobium sediminicola]